MFNPIVFKFLILSFYNIYLRSGMVKSAITNIFTFSPSPFKLIWQVCKKKTKKTIAYSDIQQLQSNVSFYLESCFWLLVEFKSNSYSPLALLDDVQAMYRGLLELFH